MSGYRFEKAFQITYLLAKYGEFSNQHCKEINSEYLRLNLEKCFTKFITNIAYFRQLSFKHSFILTFVYSRKTEGMFLLCAAKCMQCYLRIKHGVSYCDN